jgi:hypothetical protein
MIWRRECAILVFAGGLITTFRGYWSSKQITAIGPACVTRYSAMTPAEKEGTNRS